MSEEGPSVATQIAELTAQVARLAKIQEQSEDRRMPVWLEWAIGICQVLLFPAALLAGIITLPEYCSNHDRERREEAEKAYDRADSNYTDFLKSCLDHPDLDCYSGSNAAAGKDSPQQRIVFTMLVDTFEVAYVNYNNEHYARAARDSYCRQWPTWVTEIRKYLRKPLFNDVWKDVGNEFDRDYQACMNDLVREPATTDLKAPPPPSCMRISCAN